jgi:hypothetical protein
MTRTWPEDWGARKQGAGCWFCGNQLGQPFYVGSVGDAHLERHAIARGHAIVIFRDRHVADFTSLSTDSSSDNARFKLTQDGDDAVLPHHCRAGEQRPPLAPGSRVSRASTPPRIP